MEHVNKIKWFYVNMYHNLLVISVTLYNTYIRCKMTPCPRRQNNLHHRVSDLIRFAAKEDLIFLIKVRVSYCLDRKRTYIFICTVIIDYRHQCYYVIFCLESMTVIDLVGGLAWGVTG